MAHIAKVDYEAIPSHANQMRKLAQDINSELTNAYISIQNMHGSWYGKRYNALVKEFNNLIPSINELLVLIVGDIPFSLEKIANNYAQADRGSKITNATNTSPRKVADLAMPNDVGLRFITNEVTSVKTKVSTNFKNAKIKMNTIEAAYNKINWQSEGSESFKEKFTKLKKNIVEAFDSIENSFTKLMQQTLDDIQATENANTVK